MLKLTFKPLGLKDTLGIRPRVEFADSLFSTAKVLVKIDALVKEIYGAYGEVKAADTDQSDEVAFVWVIDGKVVPFMSVLIEEVDNDVETNAEPEGAL